MWRISVEFEKGNEETLRAADRQRGQMQVGTASGARRGKASPGAPGTLRCFMVDEFLVYCSAHCGIRGLWDG